MNTSSSKDTTERGLESAIPSRAPDFITPNALRETRVGVLLSSALNYHTWVFTMVPNFKMFNSWDDINDVPFDTLSTRQYIIINCASEVLELIVHLQDAPAMWNRFKQVFAGKSISQQLACVKSLTDFSLSLNSMQDGFNRMRSIERAFKSATGGADSIKFSDLCAIFLLDALPSQFIGDKAVLESQDYVTIADIETKCVRSVTMAPRFSAPVANKMSSKHYGKSESRPKCEHGYPEDRCWTCHPEARPECAPCKLKGGVKFYHKTGSRFCPFLVEKQNKPSVNAYSSSCFVSKPSFSWIIDSGCTDHMCQAASFTSYSSSSVPILTASSHSVKAQGVGAVHLESATHNLHLSKVLHSDQLGVNLLSVSTFAQKGYLTIFTDPYSYTVPAACLSPAILSFFKNNSVLTGTLDNGLYTFSSVSSGPLSSSSTCTSGLTSSTLPLSIWHHRFGHLNYCDLLRTSKLVTGLTYLDKSTPDCSPCLKSKATRGQHPSSLSRATKPGELLHMDLGIINVPSVEGYKYYLNVVDDFSRFVFVYCLTSKSDVLPVIEHLYQHIYNLFGYYPAFLRSDNAKEFSSRALADLSARCGVIQQFSCTYTPEQNGVAERMNRTLCEGTRALLEYSGFPDSFWSLAIETMAHTRNVSVTSSTGRTPYELWCNSVPDVSHLRVFGEPAYVHIPKEKRAKLDPKAELRFVVGYGQSDGKKGWRVWDPSTKSVIVSCDLKFLSSPVFPSYPENFSQSPPSLPIFTFSPSHVSAPSVPIPATDSHSIHSTSDSTSTAPFSDVSVYEDAVDSGDFPYDAPDPVVTSVPSPSSPAEPDSPSFTPDYSAVTPKNIVSSRLRPRPAASGGDSDSLTEATGLVSSLGDQGTVFGFRAQSIDPDIPENEKELDLFPNTNEWKQAMERELASMTKHKVWAPCTLPAGRKAVKSRWVFSLKYNSDGSIARYKARLVACGYSQVEGVDYSETFAPVARHTSLRVMLNLSAQEDMEIHQSDVDTAFLIPNLEEEVYMILPNGEIVKLLKCIYGLKQSPHVWNKTIDNFLKSLGLEPSTADPCIYSGMIRCYKVYLGLYVDDLIIASKSLEVVNSIKTKLHLEYSIKDLGEIRFCLGFEIVRDRQSCSLVMYQQQYIKNILARANMTTCKPISVPMDSASRLSKLMCPQSKEEREMMNKVPYRQIVGALLYLVSGTRPDIAFSVNQVCRFMQDPGKPHWEAVKRILRYLQGTKDVGIRLGGISKPLTGFSDADWAANVDNRRSCTGYVFYLNNGPVSWLSKLQRTVAQSSTESEYMALATASNEAVWLKSLLNSLGVNCSSVPLKGDNIGSLHLSTHPKDHARTKHIDVRHHLIRQYVADKIVSVEYVCSEENLADIFTKPLTSALYQPLVSKLVTPASIIGLRGGVKIKLSSDKLKG
jgi:hypothetical protein